MDTEGVEVVVEVVPEKRTIPGEMGFFNKDSGGWLTQVIQKGVLILEKIRNQNPLTEDDEAILENLYHRAWFFGWYIIPIEIELQPRKDKVTQKGLFDAELKEILPNSQANVTGTQIESPSEKPIK